MDGQRRLVDMTLDELLEVIAVRESALLERILKSQREQLPQFVYGIAGIAKIYDCSLATAQRIKNSGKIAAAITQHGRKIIVNVDKATSIYPPKQN
ncbi:MAG: DUF3853 family protein [Bacteroidales bacterium]|jgi:hypothetical protein|nr:DUF3853 family protein [Bacteroidales bacterium]MBQ5478477.1 DUF3853 family protein [Bacteroidaceae bacterium]